MTLVNKTILKYLKKHGVFISTSIDGPRELHNLNRPLQNINNSFDIVIEKLALSRKYLGSSNVSALMTSTRESLNQLNSIIDKYISLGFNEIFLRSLNPYGFAKIEHHNIGYSMDDFIANYLTAIDHIIEINLAGKFFSEAFASLILTRMLTPFSTGFVDMQSPAGVGISGVVYNYDGNVYVSDEARMLSSVGDYSFLMGNVHTHSYLEIFDSEFLHSLISSTCLETLPQCFECAFQIYCGADPVRNYSECGDIYIHYLKSDVCKRNRKIIKYFLELIKMNDSKINNILWSWVARKPLLIPEDEMVEYK